MEKMESTILIKAPLKISNLVITSKKRSSRRRIS
jgi:hypothetical protein